MGKASERAQNFIKEVGSGKLAQDLKSTYANAMKSSFSKITKKRNKLAAAKNSLKLSKLRNLKNRRSNNKELNESLNNWFEDKIINSDESDSNTELLYGKAEKPDPEQIIDDSSFLKQSKGWINNCFKRSNRTHPLLEPKQNPSSCSVEDYSNEIDLSAGFMNSKTSDLSISSNSSDQQQSKEILSKNLLKNVDDFYSWCEQQMDISTQDLLTLKKLRDNAKKKLEDLEALDDN